MKKRAQCSFCCRLFYFKIMEILILKNEVTDRILDFASLLVTKSGKFRINNPFLDSLKGKHRYKHRIFLIDKIMQIIAFKIRRKCSPNEMFLGHAITIIFFLFSLLLCFCHHEITANTLRVIFIVSCHFTFSAQATARNNGKGNGIW